MLSLRQDEAVLDMSYDMHIVCSRQQVNFALSADPVCRKRETILDPKSSVAIAH